MGKNQRGANSLTDSLFFDADCISAFLWVNEQSIVAQLYPGKIIIPKTVYNELSYPRTPHLKQRIDLMIANGDAITQELMIDNPEYEEYIKMTNNPDPGHKLIGNGEAAAIALAKETNGILASNNLRDVKGYVDKYGLRMTTTADILVEAYSKTIITEQQGNQIWAQMLARKRKLGANSFTDYLTSHNIK